MPFKSIKTYLEAIIRGRGIHGQHQATKINCRAFKAVLIKVLKNVAIPLLVKKYKNYSKEGYVFYDAMKFSPTPPIDEGKWLIYMSLKNNILHGSMGSHFLAQTSIIIP